MGVFLPAIRSGGTWVRAALQRSRHVTTQPESSGPQCSTGSKRAHLQQTRRSEPQGHAHTGRDQTTARQAPRSAQARRLLQLLISLAACILLTVAHLVCEPSNTGPCCPSACLRLSTRVVLLCCVTAATHVAHVTSAVLSSPLHTTTSHKTVSQPCAPCRPCGRCGASSRQHMTTLATQSPILRRVFQDRPPARRCAPTSRPPLVAPTSGALALKTSSQASFFGACTPPRAAASLRLMASCRRRLLACQRSTSRSSPAAPARGRRVPAPRPPLRPCLLPPPVAFHSLSALRFLRASPCFLRALPPLI